MEKEKNEKLNIPMGEKSDFREYLQQLNKSYYDKEYYEWQKRNTEFLNKIINDLINSAKIGYTNLNIPIICDHNESANFVRFFKDLNLNVDTSSTSSSHRSYILHINWY